MNKRPSLIVVLEGFLNKKSWSHTVLLEDSMAMGGNRTDLNKSRALSSVQRRLDLQALVQDFDNMIPAKYTFSNSLLMTSFNCNVVYCFLSYSHSLR
jgi:hypothetical protein